MEYDTAINKRIALINFKKPSTKENIFIQFHFYEVKE